MKNYAKALLEPFHSSVPGSRVPMVLPRETITFMSFKDISVSGAVTDKVAVFSNFESQDSISMVTITDTAMVSMLIDALPEYMTNITRGSVNYHGSGIRCGTVENWRNPSMVNVQSEEGYQRAFVKSRTVASGMRVFKTSTAENESGKLDVIYARDGANVDSSTTIAQSLGRPRSDRFRQYLAQSGTESCRGKHGFVA